jgi:hypothetical protein
MATTSFSSAQVNALRDAASDASELPRDIADGWIRSSVDPMNVLAAFDALRIRPGFVLRAYVFTEGDNGNGIVWAMPVSADFPDPAQCSRLENRFLDPPKPDGALDNYMDAIEGDGTPWSYLSASILARELGEFGARWHGCNWGTHTILGASPWEDASGLKLDEPAAAWTWKEKMPTDWLPTVTVRADRVGVRFYTFTGFHQEAIVRHTDSYKAGCYGFTSRQRKIGLGTAGYIF